VSQDCADCGLDTLALDEYYVVWPELWNRVAARDEFLCIGCLEDRLKRRLCAADFPHYPVNNARDRQASWRLIERLEDPMRLHISKPRS
jgi:hypothetical protein